MPQRIKIEASEKVMAVENCLSGKQSVSESAARLSVAESTVRDWIRLYETRGSMGLTPTVRKRIYSPDTKLSAVHDYLAGNASLREICRRYDISDKKMLRQWVRVYNGHENFKQPSGGGAVYMGKGRKTTLDERITIVSYCIAKNKDYGLTIKKYGISYQQIYAWTRKYETDGVDGLSDRRGKCKDEACMTEVEKLRAQLKLKEAENLRLQMENELLKKLDALERGRDED